MPKEGENRLYFKNYHKEMKASFVIYADLEALINKFPGCEREKEPEASNTEKTSPQETCGCAYTNVTSDRKTWGPMHYRGKNAAEMLTLQLLKYEEKTREALADKQPFVKTTEDWASYKGATKRHICENSLAKEEFLDSNLVYRIPILCTGLYCGQSQRKCMYGSRAAGPKAK